MQGIKAVGIPFLFLSYTGNILTHRYLMFGVKILPYERKWYPDTKSYYDTLNGEELGSCGDREEPNSYTIIIVV